MGGGASVPVATSKDIAAAVAALGEPYEPYAKKIDADGVDRSFLQSISTVDLPSLFTELGVTSAIHKKKLELIFATFKSNELPKDGVAMPISDGSAADNSKRQDLDSVLKAFAAFLSHFKQECGTEARLVQQNLRAILEKAPLDGCTNDIFLDSDDLSDLRNLLDHVRATKCLVLLQSRGVLTRPWVIMELYTALTNGIPIVALNVQNANPYNYAEAANFLLHFDEEIELANPGAAQLLIDLGVDPVDCAYLLSDSLPNIISTDFNPNASEKVLQASLEDLVDSMRKAKPIAPTASKEEWLEKRKEHKPSLTSHGSGVGSTLSTLSVASEPLTLAKLPLTVPELPSSFLPRPEDLDQLKGALLSKEGSNTALTSKTGKQKKQNKVGAHGMGGVGKTTIAAALVNDTEIRQAFRKILWVSVGQEPNLRELQDSLHHQLTSSHFGDDVKSDIDALSALKAAATNHKILLVLDDVWDCKFEKPLNCIDVDCGSRLLVTTRIRGLLKNSQDIELGTLPEEEALKLLLSSAEQEEELEEGSDELRIALEIVELCGKLPLTLAIAGGMISDHPDGFTDDIVEIMKEDRLRGEQDDDEEGNMTLEERIIFSSIKMLKGKNKELVEKVFHFFAVFPEDVQVPAEVFSSLANLLISEKNEKKAKLALGGALSILLKYNLIKGSLSVGSGVYMHDIVRDYVINKHTEEELRTLQKRVVETIIAGRPNDGFVAPEFAPAATFKGYVARFLFAHFRVALEDGEEPPDAWLEDTDDIIRKNVAIGVGIDTLQKMAESREETGNLVGAARLLWTIVLVKGVTQKDAIEIAYRVAEMLRSADDSNAIEFEKSVALAMWAIDMGSERHAKVQERKKQLDAATGATYLSVFNEAGNLMQLGMMNLGVFGGEYLFDESYKKFAESAARFREGGNFPGCPDNYKNWSDNLACGNNLGMFGALLTKNRAQIEEDFPMSEKNLCDGIDTYDLSVDSAMMKEQWHFDSFQLGCFLSPLYLKYGNLTHLEIWFQKATKFWQQVNLISTKNYAMYAMEAWCACIFGGAMLTVLGLNEKANEMMKLLGFTWDEDGVERLDSFVEICAGVFPVKAENMKTWIRMTMFLSSPKTAIDAESVLTWIPKPTVLADMEANDLIIKRMHPNDITSFGCRCFLRLGRDDDAYELAHLTCHPDQKTEKKTTLVAARMVLGQVAAKRGDLDEASDHFAKALEEAKQSCFPMMELLAARDWKKYLLEPSGRDCSAAESAIDAACSQLNKTRKELGDILAA